jgi:competence protein ComFC
MNWSVFLLDHLKAFKYLVYPEICVSCTKDLSYDESFLCTDCRKLITPLKDPLCKKCSRELPPFLQVSRPCSDCRNRAFSFTRNISAVKYDSTAKTLFHELKYQKRQNIVRLFYPYIDTVFNELQLDLSDLLLTCVPLDPLRQAQRGFNQSRLICEYIVKQYRIRADYSVLKRKASRTPQSMLNRSERMHNVHDLFRAGNTNAIKNKNILLVDDILTTGSTANECSRVLRAAGAKTVTIFSIARA